jgi:hypothetical protein
MQKMNQHDLTPDERKMMDALPRERRPSRRLEERTVHALKARGLLRGSPAWRLPGRGWVVVTAAAAGLALFVSGVAVGGWMSAQQTADALASIYSSPAQQAAARVQSTGTAHVEALNALTRAAGSGGAEDVERAREVALATFWAAAAEIVRLAPDDPLAARLLEELEGARRAEAGDTMGPAGARNVVWF